MRKSKAPPPALSLSKGSCSQTATTSSASTTTRDGAPRWRSWMHSLGRRRKCTHRNIWRLLKKDKQEIPDQIATSEATPRISNTRRCNLNDTGPERQEEWVEAVLEAMSAQRRSFFSSYEEYDSFVTSSESCSEDSDDSIIDGPQPSILPMDDTFDDASIISLVEDMFLQSLCTSSRQHQAPYICG